MFGKIITALCAAIVLAPAAASVLAAMDLAAPIDTAPPGSSSLLACAARDRQILMLIEEREDTNAVAAGKLNDAMFTIMHARIVCYEGHVSDALALYDTIVESVSSGRAGRLEQAGDAVGTFSFPGASGLQSKRPPSGDLREVH